MSPVCSPKLLRGGSPLEVPADLVAHHTLLRMEGDGGNQLQDWGLWLHAVQLADLRPAGVMHFSSADQLIQAAVAGQGVALGRLPLIEQLIKSRKLVAPFAGGVVSPRGYCVIVSTQAAGKRSGGLHHWLTAAARPPDSSTPEGRARS